MTYLSNVTFVVANKICKYMANLINTGIYNEMKGINCLVKKKKKDWIYNSAKRSSFSLSSISVA